MGQFLGSAQADGDDIGGDPHQLFGDKTKERRPTGDEDAPGAAAAEEPVVAGLAKAKEELQDATMWLMANGLANPDNAGAASTDYMHLFGLTALAYMWAMMAQAAQAKIAAGETNSFYATKLTLARYYAERILPETSAHLAKLKTGADTLMSLPAEAF